MCETYLTSEQRLKDLAEHAALTKRVSKIPQSLGLHKHPWWLALDSRTSTNAKVRCLSWILYRCDETSHFADISNVINADKQAKKKRRVEALKTLERTKQRLTLERVLTSSATSHCRAVAGRDEVFSMQLQNVHSHQQPQLIGLRQHLATSNARASTTEGGFEHDTDVTGAFEEQPSGSSDAKVYFRVVHFNPSKQKLQERPAAAGRRFAKGDVAIHVLDGAPSVAGVDSRGVAISVGAVQEEKSVVVRSFGGDVAWLRTAIYRHEERDSLEYNFHGVTANDDE